MNLSYVKVKVNVKFALEQAKKAQRGSRCIVLPFLQPRCFTPGKDPVPIVWEAVWAPEPVWTGAEHKQKYSVVNVRVGYTC